MSDNSKINIYINSKNRRTDETASNFIHIGIDTNISLIIKLFFKFNYIKFIKSFNRCSVFNN